MAESYFSASHAHPDADVSDADSSPLDVDPVQYVAAAENVQQAYAEHRDRLLGGIDATQTLLGDLKTFNKDSYTLRYPHVDRNSSQESSNTIPSPRHLQRSMSFADDPASHLNVILENKPLRKGLARRTTLAAVPEPSSPTTTVAGSESSDADTLFDGSADANFRILQLDLKLGAPGSSSKSAALVSQLEKASIANLLEERITSASRHIIKLRNRVKDTSSKVLVTGDLNAGKSTFVNALLQRDIMPVDQQPCTTLFCEVHDKEDNDGVEEVHVVDRGVAYDRTDESTYNRVKLTELEDVVAEHESSELTEDAQHPPMIHLYVGDARDPTSSLISNGVVDIALIDAPGLNRDSLHTTSLFARQEEIDVVVFVVSAENHFTLSAKEFLWNASNEKAYVFIVVNRFDQIKDKERCKRRVLEQIRQLSPHTYEDADDLVHFVDSASALAQGLLHQAEEEKGLAVEGKTDSELSFERLETSLRSFVLVKRAKSKLLPAATYLSNILSDVDLLASANSLAAQNEIADAQASLAVSRPILQKMQKGRDHLEEGLEEEEESTTNSATLSSRARLDAALERVGKGDVAVAAGDVGSDSVKLPRLPSYPGVLGIWDYARDVRKVMLESIDLAIKLAEDEARSLTTSGVQSIEGLADEHLPAHVERSKRVFMPEAMFVPRLQSSNSKHRRKPSVVAGGTQGLGIGLLPLANRADLTEVTFVDILDINHAVVARFGLLAGDKKNAEQDVVDSEDDASASVLSTLGLGMGAITMVGGRTIGARGLLEGIVRLGEVLGNEGTRKWIAPVIGAATLGLGVYLVYELPSTVPRTVGRRIRVSLLKPGAATDPEAPRSHTLTRSRADMIELPFIAAHAARISRETRKVMRLAAWDVRERFRGAMEDSGRQVKEAEESERRATKAFAWFSDVLERTETIRVSTVLESES